MKWQKLRHTSWIIYSGTTVNAPNLLCSLKYRAGEMRPRVGPAPYMDGRNIVNAISQLMLPVKKQSTVQIID